jgi:hypothetical protein
MANRVQAEATILESVYDPDGATRDGVDANRDDGLVGLLTDKALGIPYEFLLEVRVPGLAPAQVRVRDRVPDKVEKLAFFDHIRVPVSLVVPVTADPQAPEQVVIDWKAFLAQPDRVEQMTDAARRAQAASVGAPVAAAEMNEQDSATRLMIFGVAQQVRAGSVPRSQLEMMCQQLLQVGQLSRADADAALAAADGA